MGFDIDLDLFDKKDLKRTNEIQGHWRKQGGVQKKTCVHPLKLYLHNDFSRKY